jgi:hypothetical protein
VADAPDPIDSYMTDAARSRRRQMARVAGILGVGAVGSFALVTRMTDIGHAVAFIGLGVALSIGAGVMLWQRPPSD